MKYPHIAARLFNTPLLVHPAKLDAIIAGLGGRVLGGNVVVVQAQAQQQPIAPDAFSTRRGERAERGYRIVDGVAVLSAMGALVHRTKLDADSSLLIGYNDLAADLEDAMSNPEVHAVLQVLDSPGGEVAGAFEYASRIHAWRGRKPMHAIADDMAASAAYLSGSAFEQIAVTSTGYVGSIGVVMRHVDFSRALDDAGYRVTQIFAGAHKVDGNPYEALPAAVRADMQAEINGLYTMFVDAVVRHRGISAESVRATQARVYRGEAAVSMGLADRVSTTDALISELAALRARSYPAGPAARSNANTTGGIMSGTTTEAPAGAPQTAAASSTAGPAITQADVDKARAEGHQAGVSAERARVGAILGHERAASSMALAVQCVTQGLSAEQAGAILATAPAATQATAPNNAFAAAMASVGNPNVSGIEAAGDGGTTEESLAASIVGLITNSK